MAVAQAPHSHHSCWLITHCPQPSLLYCTLCKAADHTPDKVHTLVGKSITPHERISRRALTCHNFIRVPLSRSCRLAPAAATTLLMLSQMLRHGLQSQGQQRTSVPLHQQNPGQHW